MARFRPTIRYSVAPRYNSSADPRENDKEPISKLTRRDSSSAAGGSQNDSLWARQVRAYLGLGSNLGGREANLNQALTLLREKLQVTKVSPFYETEPVGYLDQPKFLNAACEVLTDLTPGELLTFVKGIETEMGRTLSFRNAPRVLDIDILLYGDLVLDTPELTIPHPRMLERAFVLVPLADIAPKVIHPVAKKSVRLLLKEVGGKEEVRRWS